MPGLSSIKNSSKPIKASKLIYLSVAAAIITILLKSGAYLLTGSVGLLSDAAESLINLVAALVALVALTLAARPPDPSHPYGYEKAEYFSSLIEAILILGAAFAIGWAAVERFMHLQPLQSLGWGLGVALIATLINLAVGQVLIKNGQKIESIALEADGKHLMTDVWTTVGVLVGLGLVWLTNWLWLDPLIAIGVALNIAFTAGRLIQQSMAGLMDKALPDEDEARIRAVIEKVLIEDFQYHKLRSRKSASYRFVDLHLLTNGKRSLAEVHDQAEAIEVALKKEFGKIRVLIHEEPLEDPRAYEDE
jgi:cation diffusion facilitator family transporter